MSDDLDVPNATNPTGEAQNGVLHLDFDRRVMVQFRGSLGLKESAAGMNSGSMQAAYDAAVSGLHYNDRCEDSGDKVPIVGATLAAEISSALAGLDVAADGAVKTGLDTIVAAIKAKATALLA